MCLNPIFLRKKGNEDSYKSRLTFVENHVGFDLPDLLKPYRYSRMFVPCGKCTECLRDKQNDIAVRSYIEAKKKGSMHFVTLTYKDEFLPFAKRLYLVDSKTGETFSDCLESVIDRDDMSDELHQYILNEFKVYKKNPRSFNLFLDGSQAVELYRDLPFLDDDYHYYYNVTPSLYRRDVRLWLKKCRVNYERKFGKKLSSFTYIMVGEMGSKTCRPHYHLCFFGAKDEEIQWMCSNWKYGYFDVEKVKVFNKDGSSGFLAAARYIAKYIYKGSFEADSVKNGDAESPRYCTSIGFGVDLNDKLIDFYRCYDLFGWYGVNSSVYYNSLNRFTLPTLKKLHEEVKKRCRVDINGFSYKLPKNTLKRLFYVKDSKGIYKPSAVQMAFDSFVCGDILDDFIDRFKKDNPFVEDSEMDIAVFRFIQNQKSIVKEKDKANIKINSSFYAKSRF